MADVNVNSNSGSETSEIGAMEEEERNTLNNAGGALGRLASVLRVIRMYAARLLTLRTVRAITFQVIEGMGLKVTPFLEIFAILFDMSSLMAYYRSGRQE
ncbi:hypothetical protein Sjap_009330 [Stephania japonica]|uniref:Uncharacterized protein n=1 Tax=Stephania japonica TaxID=461633 RepID=A0AAP0JRV5_9MAGN